MATARAVVVACDKFKGTLSGEQVARAVTAGLLAAHPELEVRVIPVADGGDGTLDAVVAAGFRRKPVTVAGPTGEPVETAFAVRGPTAVVELADACGLGRLPGGQLAPESASSLGLGQAIRAALEDGYREIIVGVGGSASSDGGAGMVEALGAVPRDSAGQAVGHGGEALANVASLDLSGLLPAVAETTFVLACDVENPLLGEQGAVAVYGPQKGAAPGPTAERLEAGLRAWADAVDAATGTDMRAVPGAGAAGGVGFAAVAVLGAAFRPGIDIALDLGGFDESVRGAALVVTGEGAIDAQTLQGKAPAGVARRARGAGVPVVAVCGHCALDVGAAAAAGIGHVYALTDIEPDIEACRREARSLLEQLAQNLGRELIGPGAPCE